MTKRYDQTREVFLVLRCQSGDREAFDELLNSVQMKLWGYISNLMHDRDLAEDVLPEVFLIIYRKIGWLNEPRLFRPWIYRIASREAFRMMKKRAAWREDTEVLENFPADRHELVFDPDLAEKLPHMLQNISPASRAVLILHYVEEMSLNETADVLDISVGTAKSRLAYGLTQMRKAIK